MWQWKKVQEVLFNEITIGFLSAKLGIAARVAIRIPPDELDEGKVERKIEYPGGARHPERHAALVE